MLPPPIWLPAEEVDAAIEEYGCAFLNLFTNLAHWRNYLTTGDMRRPASITQAKRLDADPIKHQREVLRKRVGTIARSCREAADKIATAREALARKTLAHYSYPQIIADQTARLAERQRDLQEAQVNLDLFDALHRATVAGDEPSR